MLEGPGDEEVYVGLNDLRGARHRDRSRAARMITSLEFNFLVLARARVQGLYRHGTYKKATKGH